MEKRCPYCNRHLTEDEFYCYICEEDIRDTFPINSERSPKQLYRESRESVSDIKDSVQKRLEQIKSESKKTHDDTKEKVEMKTAIRVVSRHPKKEIKVEKKVWVPLEDHKPYYHQVT